MLNNIKGKYVVVGVAFNGAGPSTMYTVCYEGKVIDFDKDFIMFEDCSMIGIRYIQTIKVKKDN